LCGRAGTATGQNAARPGTGAPPQAKAKAKAKARVAPAVALAAPPAPHAPVGRAGALSLEVLDTIEWYGAILQQVEYASEVVLATYMFDHKPLTELFLQRLASRFAFDLTILIDQEMLHGRTPYHQRARLDSLRRAHANIWLLCQGMSGRGAMHMKALVCDRRWAFTGSANFTTKSMENAELCMRMRGPPVQSILGRMEAVRLNAVSWDGTLPSR